MICIKNQDDQRSHQAHLMNENKVIVVYRMQSSVFERAKRKREGEIHIINVLILKSISKPDCIGPPLVLFIVYDFIESSEQCGWWVPNRIVIAVLTLSIRAILDF